MSSDRDEEPREAAGPTSEGERAWKPRLDALEHRLTRARAMGGTEKLEKRAALGELSARARIDALLDPGTFRELGTLVGGNTAEGEPPAPADAFPAGFGRIDGRPVLVGAEDPTVMGGSIGLGGADKRYRLTQLARQERLPLVFVLHGAGHRMTNALKGHGRTPNDLQGLVDLAGLVPTVCVVLGASAGHSALAAPLMDYAVMSEAAAVFAAGPPLVIAATGESVTKEELGGPDVSVRQGGVVHDVAADDGGALEAARAYLSYFPTNAWQAPPRREADDGSRRLDDILDLVPEDLRKPYKMTRVLERLVDRDSLMVVQPRHGRALVTALARLGGRSVAIVANDPGYKAGTLDAEAAEKGARFIEVVGAFHLPVVFLADNPGVMAGLAAERSGALRAAARMFAAQHRLTVPKLHVTLRKAFGFGSSVMAMNPFDGQTISLAFPNASMGAMPAKGGGAASKASESDQEALDAREIDGPWGIADSMAFDEIIDPRDLRNALLTGLEISEARAIGPFEPVAPHGALP